MMPSLPHLYVEGKDDVSVVNALLYRHGLDTEKGKKYLKIMDLGSIDAVLESIPDAIRANTERPVGFVIDIDIEIASRWDAVHRRITQAGASPPKSCPSSGYIAMLEGYQRPFGVWLMPDCTSDGFKLEHLIQTLVPNEDPLWPIAMRSTDEAFEIAKASNERHKARVCNAFHEVDRIKAEVHTWLAWQCRPGAPMGAAVNSQILGCDSVQAIAFLKWIKALFGFESLQV
jgi:hypothetical protein